jgi:hypothetical protein
MTRERDGTEPEVDLVIEVTPEPTRDELDALIAALAVWSQEMEPDPEPVPSRWAMAGRLEAHSGLNPHVRCGTGRAGLGRGG